VLKKGRMLAAYQNSETLLNGLRQRAIKRLPLTFLPFVNQQLDQWQFLFPNERRAVEHLLEFVASLSDEQAEAVFHDVVALEGKMGVRHWQFSTHEQTIENSAELARSPYFQEWRRAVQAVFDAAERHAEKKQTSPRGSQRRLVLLEIPAALPLNPATAWRSWQGIGKAVKLDLPPADAHPGSLAGLLLGSSRQSSPGLLDAARDHAAQADTWVIDAGRELVEAIAGRANSSSPAPILLSYCRLDSCRESFSREMNGMRKDLADADAVFDHLRKVDISAWCPPEVVSDLAVREFVRSVYLSGNGAVIFANSFVEWAASEAFRRARPSFLAARFGVRKKPKPFTGVAVFENPDQANPLPPVDDFEGSALDAQMLALYVWLATSRFDEYRSAVCICIAESLSQAYIVAPPEFSLIHDPEPITLGRLNDALLQWIT
jgi:hypothetical protein